MRLWLAPTIHAVSIGADIVFLDVEADAYLCLAGGGDCLRLGPGGAIEADPARAAAALRQAGLVIAQAPTAPRRTALPVRRGRPQGAQPTNLGAIASAVGANWRAAEAIAKLSFRQILDLAGPFSLRAFDSPTPALLAESGRFDRMAPWLPRNGVCLMRSLQQRLYLARRGFRVAWVFGVRAWPFEAHCWLQAGEVVLDDTPEHAGGFSPILVV